MKIKYSYDRDLDKKALNPSVRNQKPSSSYGKSKFICIFLTILFIWIIYSLLAGDSEPKSSDDVLCGGDEIKTRVCHKLNSYETTGRLCLELCLNDELKLRRCSDEISFKSQSSDKYRYFQMADLESTLIYVENDEPSQRLTETLTFDEFRDLIKNFIMRRLDDSTTVDKIIDRIIYTTDSNNDQKLNYQEANTLWTLLNNKATFYILILSDKTFVPQIKNFCGNLVELVEIKHHLRQPIDYSLIKSVFSSSVYWYKINALYRVKIALGILEFFSYATSFNPNTDEFSTTTPSSLLLCAPIDLSFGYTYFNEAKLINYDGVLTTREAVERLNGSETKCRFDSDCVLNDHCAFQCDVNTGKCTGKLVKLQLSSYCEFLRKFFQDDANITTELEPLLKKCIELKPFYADHEVLYGKSEMPLAYSKVNEFVQRREFWSQAEDYSMLINELERVMWERVRLAADPKRPKKNKKAKAKSEDETKSV